LESIPIINKSILQDNLKKINWLDSSLLYSETSGTTGTPLPTPRGKEDLQWNAFNQACAYRRFITPSNDRVAILHPSILSPFVEASVMALHELNIGHVRLFPIPNLCDYLKLYDIIDRYAVTTIMSTPSLVYKLLYEFKRQRGNIPGVLKKLLLTGEPLSLASIKNFRKIIGIDDETLVTPFVYGSSEIATVMHGKKDSLFEPILEDFVFELHKDNDSHEGYRLIVSWLREGIMPILRYDTGDYFYLTNSDDVPLMKFLGRTPFDASCHSIEEKIENAIYSLPDPVYHFNCIYSMHTKSININMVTTIYNEKTYGVLKEKISYEMPGWKIKTGIAGSKEKFFEFSPKTKTNKFQRV